MSEQGEYGPDDWVESASRAVNTRAADGYNLQTRSVLHREGCPALMRVEPAKTTAMDLAQMYRRLLYPDQHERPLRFCGRCKTGQVQDRADRYRAAGLTPEEAARMELDGTVDWDALAHLAALRGHRLGSIRPDTLLTA